MLLTLLRPGAACLALFLLPLTCLAKNVGDTVPQHALTPASQAFHPLRDELLERIEAGSLPSIAIAVIDQGELVWAETLGFADSVARTPATPQHSYALGSVAKSFTATIIMRLVSEGKIDLSAPANRYLPKKLRLAFANGKSNKATIRQLLSMSGGLGHGGGFIVEETGELPAHKKARDAYFREMAATAFPVGAVYEYSNYSYGVLERIIEEVTGDPYEAAARRLLLDPLGMSGAAFHSGESANPAPMHTVNGDVRGFYHFLPVGAGGVYANLKDMIAYASYHLGQSDITLMSEDLRQSMYEPLRAVPGQIIGLGFGALQEEGGPAWYLTNGNVIGGNAHFTFLPERGAAVIVAINQTRLDDLADEMALRIADIVQPGFAEFAAGLIGSYGAASRAPFDAGSGWAGSWRGKLKLDGKARKVVLRVGEDATVRFEEIGAEPVLLENTTFGYGVLRGGLTLPEPDGTTRVLPIHLYKSGSSLWGYAVAVRRGEGFHYNVVRPMILKQRERN